ncbi:MAG: hypothetical protein IPN16_19575 [Gemmatimonadetes bacterium]|nr:hypothetical protein [Gemmatimonadota bacterium]
MRVEITGEKIRGEWARLTFHLPLQGRKSEPEEGSGDGTDAGWRLHLLGQGK